MSKSFVTLVVAAGLVLVGSSYAEWIGGTKGWKLTGDTLYTHANERVGFGTQSPEERLHVVGNVYLTKSLKFRKDTTQYLWNFKTSPSWGLYWNSSDSTLYWKGSGSKRMSRRKPLLSTWQSSRAADKMTLNLNTGAAYFAGALDATGFTEGGNDTLSNDINGNAATATDADLLDGHHGSYYLDVPSGVIVMWSGTQGSIPDGWTLCDGTKGTPDLTDRFIYGSTVAASGETGGSTSHSHTYSDLPQHTHDIQDDGHSHQVNMQMCKDGTGAPYSMWGFACSGGVGSSCLTTTENSNVSVVATGSTSCSTNPTTTVPPYFKLAFIMKL